MTVGTMTVEAGELLRNLQRLVLGQVATDGITATGLPGLSLYRQSAPTECTTAAYVPRMILYLGGGKRVRVGERTLTGHAGNLLLVAVDLPVLSEVTEASVEEPTVAILMDLEMVRVREILSREELAGGAGAGLGSSVRPTAGPRGLTQTWADGEMLKAFTRLIELLDRPEEMGFLHGIIQREILYRVLRSELGGHLRAIATVGEQSNRAARAVAWLRVNYDRPLKVEELAMVAQMGVSTFHHHFRSLTAMSPLQYQKRLRLHMARLKMLTDGMDAANAAFAVGYESPSQFSREYSRLFGQPPMRDVKSRQGMSLAVDHE